MAEGKTKLILPTSDPRQVLVLSKDSITAGNGLKRDVIEGKGRLSNETTCGVFRLLQLSGLPTHFLGQEGPDSFRALSCRMVPVEVIVRRLATGSFLKTHPQYKEGDVLFPLVVEFTMKSDEQGDPLITEEEMVANGVADWARIETMKSLARRAFLILEKAWKRLNVTLVDFKVEFGVSQAGDLVLADVIDNDSWRLWPNGEKRLMKDKQVYRNMPIPGPGLATAEQKRVVLDNYAWVAEGARKLIDSIASAQPKSGPLVGVIMGSQSDWATMQHATGLLEELGVAYETKIVSAHRTPARLCAYARSAKQRGLKVIIAGAGGAAHLPGMTASMTPLPVLGVPVKTSTLSGQDSLLSIVQMPRGIPVGTLAIGDAGAANAAILAASILAAHPEYADIAQALDHFRSKQTLAVAEEPTTTTTTTASSSSPAEKPAAPAKLAAPKLAAQPGPAFLPPGSVIGVVGGGQLARMIGTAAACLGYRMHVFCPDADSPAFHVADEVTVADYLDLTALESFASAVDVVTYEFENVPLECVQHLATWRPVRPSPFVLQTCQHRFREKTFVNDVCGAGTTTAFARASSLEELRQAVEQVGLPAVLKTTQGGYDGKGQVKIAAPEEVEKAWAAVGGGSVECVVEAWVEFECELSVIVARRSLPSGASAEGAVELFPVAQNEHEHHILRRSTIPPPAPLSDGVRQQIHHIATSLATALDLSGLVCIEMFLVNKDGQQKILVNELAPRPHNSGHWTIEGCTTSQFEQLVRAICGLPLAQTRVVPGVDKVVMTNLIGHEADDALALLATNPNAHLHLYGKRLPRAGRKMGHVTTLHYSS